MNDRFLPRGDDDRIVSSDRPERTEITSQHHAWATRARLASLVPGLSLCLVITLAAMAVQIVEVHRLGHPYVDALVIAILAGALTRTIWTPSPKFRAGIAFCAKQLLEFAVALLGASLSLSAVLASGSSLLAGIAGTVVVAIVASVAICLVLRLPHRMAILVACGNAICGNSAIAAIAPVIGADSRDVAAAIAFTAVLGVLMVLGLPLFVPLAGLSENQYGVLAGLTVYAVPQVLAATLPVGLLSTQVGTLVKLVRVLMLGPVVVAFSLIAPRLPPEGDTALSRHRELPRGWLLLTALVPWFILGFLVLASLRAFGFIPDSAVTPLAHIAGFLTILSMAALGLGVDMRALAKVGVRVTVAVTASSAVLIAVSLLLIQALNLR